MRPVCRISRDFPGCVRVYRAWQQSGAAARLRLLGSAARVYDRHFLQAAYYRSHLQRSQSERALDARRGVGAGL